MDGDTLQFAANGVEQDGTFLDPNGTITMNSVHLIGHLYGGDDSDMQIVSGGDVVPEVGTSLIASIVLLLAFLIEACRKFKSA